MLYYNLGLTSLGAGLRDAGIRSLRKADDIYIALGDAGRAGRVPVLVSLGDAQNRMLAAIERYDEALEISADAYGETSADHASVLYSVGVTTLTSDEWRRAKPYLDASHRIFAQILPIEHASRTNAVYALARWQLRANEDATQYLQSAVAGFEAADNTGHPDYRRALESLEKMARTNDDEALQQIVAQKRADNSIVVPVDENEYLPLARVAPDYPRSALRDGIQGYVDFSFTVDTRGRPTDIQIVGGENVRVFAESAKRALRRFKYKPRVVDGVAVDVPNVETRIRFAIRY
ncbi:MAG: TonB family protein [Pseudomonadota bacterium]